MPEGTLNKIYINRTFNCPSEQLFEWLVQPQLIAEWFGPKHFSISEVQVDLKIGGNYCIELLKPDGHHFFITGEYQKIENPNLIVFTFNYEGLTPLPPESIVIIKIEEKTQNQSNLILTQEFITIPSDMASRSATWEVMFFTLASKISK